MPVNAKVFIHYGPYEACGIVDHRQPRLEGLKCMLTGDGHTVETVEIEDWNRVELWVNGEKIFTCDIRNLDYGSDGELDPLCNEALKSVRKAF
ncbi:hypothetical protein ACJMK2_034948 [Sinanodonta woodiana]|uniref:Uncharacterized protein n=1 Tax=Sinanodonta woodiana TaxID=1069815 RepID=A0ABD3WWP9_SINWO